jgi:hypothetical protein
VGGIGIAQSANSEVVAYCRGSRYLRAIPHGQKEDYTHKLLQHPEGVGILIAFLSEGLATAALMYFRFRARPATWSMRIVSLVIAVVISIAAIISLFVVVTSYGDPAWKSILLFVLSYVPIAYIAALVGSLLIFLIDTARLRFLNFVSDPPDIFFGFYWTQSRVSYALIVVPVAIFVIICSALEITSHISVHSPVTLSVPSAQSRFEFDHYQITKPLLFRLNEPKLLTVEHLGEAMQAHATCRLSSPGFELESIDVNTMQSLPKGQTAESPRCIWIATARLRGSQTLVLRMSPSFIYDDSDDTKSDSPYVTVYIETAHVVGEPFTMPTMLVVVLLTGLLVGLLRLARTGEINDVSDLTGKTPKRERRKIEIEEVSNLYEGETKIK